MEAPQYIMIALIVISLLISANEHGTEKIGTHKFPLDFVCILIHQALLYWGGFYN